MTNTEGSGDRELEEKELGRSEPAQVEELDEEEDTDEVEELARGAETKADLDEEAGQANRPGTERPPV